MSWWSGESIALKEHIWKDGFLIRLLLVGRRRRRSLLHPNIINDEEMQEEKKINGVHDERPKDVGVRDVTIHT